MTSLERNSPCKVNLLLNTLGTRPDGFHELETIMHPVALHDTLQFERRTASGVELSCNHPGLPTDASNLIHRAASSFLQAAGIRDGLRIHLQKRIPLAAGLGGGSSNAATTLLALSDLFANPLGSQELARLAATLGSDVPFFLQPLPALAGGRGEEITPLDPFQSLRNVAVLLAYPGFGVPTAWAYQALARFPQAQHGTKGRAQQLISVLRSGTLEEARSLFYNSLEFPVFRKYPILQLYQEFLRQQGALAALMSGSGSTTFALVESEPAGKALASQFIQKFGESCWTAVIPLW